MLFTNNKKWILGSFKKDFAAFYLPGAATTIFLLFYSLSADQFLFIFLAWLFFGVLDSGHVYTSVWRTYLDKKEFKRRKWTYLLSPLIIFTAFYLISLFDFILLGAIVVYATLYHNMRQFYGMSKWYQKVNSSFDKISDYFFYILTVLCFVTVHFRTDLQLSEYYPNANRFLYPNLFLVKICLFLFFLTLLAWSIYEFHKAYKTGELEWARLLSIAFPVGLYAVSFLHFKTLPTIVFPLVVSHGLSYMVLIHQSARKTAEPEKIISWGLPVTILAVALVFGSLEFYFDDFEFANPNSGFKPLLAALLLTPLFCHYYFDAFLWKSSHPDFHKIIS
jgi:hypothetical protein